MTGCKALLHVSLLDQLMDGSDVLLKEWTTTEMVEALCEVTKQVR